jgi:hypothetical protein
MTGDEIRSALEKLAGILNERTRGANLYLVGGAVMVLSQQARDGTDVVDAVFNGQADVLDAAREVAEDLGLSERWINSDALMYLPQGKEPEWEVLWVLGSVTIHIANTQTMLAMKLKAGRPIRDGADIAFLLRASNITSETDAVAVFEEFYPDDVLSPRSLALLRDVLEINSAEVSPSTLE